MSAPVFQANLPPGWTITPLAEVAHLQLGKMLDREKQIHGQRLPYLRNANVRWGTFDLSDLLEMPFEKDEIERFDLRPGDVVICEGGEPGRSAVWTQSNSAIKFQKALHRVRLHGGIEPQWLMFHLMRDATTGALARRFTGTTIKHLPREGLEQYVLRLAPLREQREMVATIDSYFSRLDDAVASLKRVQANLKRYRASVLKAAVEGRLVPTEAELARKEGRNYEPASVLLDRILTERRRRWEEAELAKMKANGKAPRDGCGRRKYKEPVAPDTTGLPEPPEGWCWTTLDALAEIVGGITKGQRRDGRETLREVPYLRVANVQRGYLDLGEIKMIAASEAEIETLRLRVGDVLFNEGGDRDKLGRGWIWQGELPECIHQNHVFRARPLVEDIIPEFLSWYGNTEGQRYFDAKGSQTTNLASLNLTNLRALPVPLPPAAEQVRIKSEAERLLSVQGNLVSTVEVSTVHANALRQRILQWAFEGKLVDQDPRDEPASVLLERIRTERAATKPEMKTRNRRAKAKAA